VRERGVNLWSGFRFPDSELEWIRLGRVAEGHIACAALHLQSDELPAARRHLAQARVVQPSAERVRRLALSAVAYHPALPRIARRVWKLYRRLRPYRPAPFGSQAPSSVRLLEDVL